MAIGANETQIFQAIVMPVVAASFFQSKKSKNASK